MSKQKQKEPLPIMIAKTALAIAIITGLGTIIFGGGVVIMKYYNSEINNRIVRQQTKNLQKDTQEQDIDEENGLRKYTNEDFGIEFTFQDNNNEVAIDGNPNYLKLKMKDVNDFCRGYIYINFFHIMDEEYHYESLKGITYSNLEEYIKYTYSVKRKGRNENDYIVKMERVKNDENVNILEVIIGDEATDYSRKEYYIDYDDAIYGNYKNGKDYLTISRAATYLFDDIEKEQQSKQFNQILSSFKFIEKDNTSDWQTYRNEEFGFEVKYPENWIIENNILYSSEMYNMREGGPYSLFITIDSSFNSVDEFLESQKECITDSANFTINNQKLVRYSDICSFNIPTKTIMIVENQTVIGISYSISDESKTINQIISTFKFIEK